MAMLLHGIVLSLFLLEGTLEVRAHDAPKLLDPSYTLQQWTIDEGLPVNTVYDLQFGPDGFLWLATHDGLVRFDGNEFRTFTVTTTPALASNRIRQLWRSPNGILWIQMYDRALVRYQNQTFTQMDSTHGLPTNRAWVLRDTVSTGLAVGSIDGLRRYDPHTERFIQVAPEIIRDEARSTRRAPDGGLWVGTRSGHVTKIRPTPNGRWAGVDRLPHQQSSREAVQQMTIDASGTLWVGFTRRVIRYDGTSIHRSTRTGQPYPRRASGAGRSMLQLQSRTVNLHPVGDAVQLSTADRMFWLHRDSVAIGRAEPTWWRQSTEACQWRGIGQSVWCGERRIVTGAGQFVQAITDSTGALWIGTYNQGLLRIGPSRFRTLSVEEGLAGRNVYGLHQTTDGTLWTASTSGVSRLHPDGRITTIPNDRLPSANVLTIHQQRGGALWMGTRQGACHFRNGQCEVVPASRGHDVYAIYQDRQGALWMSLAGVGLIRRRPGDTRWHRADKGLPAGVEVQRIMETRDGALWVGTKTRGIARWTGARFESLTPDDGLPIGQVREIFEDRTGALMLGTEGAGLVRLQIQNDSLRVLSLQQVRVRDGLPGNSIHRILADDQGRLWMSSNQGIFWVRASDLIRHLEIPTKVTQIHVTHYDTRDGLRLREANGGVQGAGIRSDDGTLWFPTQDGIAGIHPSDEPVTRPAPQPFIEEVRSNRTSVAPERDGAIRLNPNQRTFAIRFTAPALNAPDDVVYRYKLEGFDSQWTGRQGTREAFYTNVPPGQYRFRVIAERERTSDREATIRIHVVPRFYEQTAFWLLLLFFAGLGTVAIVRYRIIYEEKRAERLQRMVADRIRELQEAKEEAETANELKSRFLAHVTHDLRTPLTGIIGFAEVLQEETDGQLERFATLIEQSARRSESMVESLLELSRLQSNAHEVENKPLDVSPIVSDVIDMIAHRAEAHSVDLHWEAPTAPLRACADEAGIERVVENLVGNAIKYSEAGDEVTVELTSNRSEQRVMLDVRDTGMGIDPDFLPHLFEPFTRGISDDEGSGLGLAIAHEFVEKMDGTITVHSELGEGTHFRVVLPACS